MSLFEETLDRREFLRLTGLTAGALALASCSFGTSTSSNQLDEWVWAVAEDPSTNSNLLQPGGAVGSIRVFQQVFDSVIYAQGRDLNMYGFIAESWEYVSPTQIRLHLRKGLTFHNGDPVTADDVKYTLDKALADPKLFLSYYIGALKRVDVIDANTCDLILSQQFGPFLYTLASFAGSIVPKKVREAGVDAFNKKPVGSGPFKLVSDWNSGQPIQLEAWPD